MSKFTKSVFPGITFSRTVAFSLFSAAIFTLGYGWGHYSLQQTEESPTKAASIGAQNILLYPETNPGHRQNLVSANGSAELKQFLQNREALEKSYQLQTNGDILQFQARNADLLKRQSELAKALARQQAKTPIPLPPPLRIAPNASPQLETYLKMHDQLMRDQIEFLNEHQNDDPTQRQEAMQQWRQESAKRFQQLQLQAQALSQASQT